MDESMDGRPDLPNYDPAFCLKVAKWAAASCVGWLTIELLILTLVDPGNSRCPGWFIGNKNGPISLWVLVAMFTAVPTIWICYVVLRWERFSQQIYDSAAPTYRPFMTPKSLHDRYKPGPVTFPFNRVFVIAVVGWSLFCTAPLWMLLANCTKLPGYLGYQGVGSLVRSPDAETKPNELVLVGF
jgi:hypothetical protein